MLKNIFIIHGAYGNRGENWFPWICKELEKNDFQVFVPNFPTPQGQSLENWIKIFNEYEEYFDEDTILVGHSLGVSFILNVLEKTQKHIKACFFVAGFADFLGIDDLDAINESFVDREFDWGKIRANCGNFHIYHSDNDPYVPLEKAEAVAEKLDVEIKMIKNGGHLNSAARYDRFELLLEDIKQLG